MLHSAENEDLQLLVVVSYISLLCLEHHLELRVQSLYGQHLTCRYHHHGVSLNQSLLRDYRPLGVTQMNIANTFSKFDINIYQLVT